VLSVAEVVATASGNRIVGIFAPDEEGRSGSLQFSDGVNSVGIIMAENSSGANLVLPSESGTIALTSDIPTDVNNITSDTTSDGTCDLQVASLSVSPNGQLALASSNSGGVVVLNGQQATDARIIAFPDASGTVALTSQTVLKSDYTPAHSILAQQSGTGSPTAVTLGNNTILGRMSGGGSNIAGLSASDARTVMGLGTLATVNGGTGVADFLASPTSANLRSAITDPTGTGANVFAISPTLTSPTIGTSATFNATTYTYGAGAAAAMNKALGYMRVVRTTDLSRATSGTLADDDVLIVALDASSVYKVSYVFLSSNAGGGGMGSQINYSGTLLGTAGDSIGNAALATSSSTTSIVVSTAATVGTVGTVIIRTNTAGNLSYAWRNYGTGTSTNRAGSLLDITKLA
jgi:hypothetical protein